MTLKEKMAMDRAGKLVKKSTYWTYKEMKAACVETYGLDK